MPRKKRQLRIKVTGSKRRTIDTRRLARAIIRLAIEQGTDEAQRLADQLEHGEALTRRAITRQRSADHEASEAEAASEDPTDTLSAR